jgi:hypothetical protein
VNVSGSRYNYGSILTVSGSGNVVHTTATGSFRAAFYNYVAFSGSNARAGQVSNVWFGTTSSYAETMTTDIGTTVGLTVYARVTQSLAQLVADTTTAGWTIETSVNLI